MAYIQPMQVYDISIFQMNVAFEIIKKITIF